MGGSEFLYWREQSRRKADVAFGSVPVEDQVFSTLQKRGEVVERQESDVTLREQLTRKHASDDPAARVGTEDTTADGFNAAISAPVSTKAGGRVWSLYFVAPPPAATTITALRAAYPCQLLVSCVAS